MGEQFSRPRVRVASPLRARGAAAVRTPSRCVARVGVRDAPGFRARVCGCARIVPALLVLRWVCAPPELRRAVADCGEKSHTVGEDGLQRSLSPALTRLCTK